LVVCRNVTSTVSLADRHYVKRREGNEARTYLGRYGRSCGLRDDPAAAGDANLRGRIPDPGDDPVSTAAAAATTSASCNDDLS
jgi:hypothetical protein